MVTHGSSVDHVTREYSGTYRSIMVTHGTSVNTVEPTGL